MMAEKFTRIDERRLEGLEDENEQLREQAQAYTNLQARIPEIATEAAEDVIQDLDEEELLAVHRGERDLESVLHDY